ncbi:MAG: hypothetical protein ABH800_01195 [Candidatus Nealsonbacteria bacterium]
MKSKVIVFSLIFFLFCQLVYCFLFPTAGFTDNWLPVSSYLPKFEVGSNDNFILNKIYPLIPSEYRLNSDVGGYLELARNFSSEYFKGDPYLNRPLYPFLLLLLSFPIFLFTSPSYGIIFALAIFLNFAFIVGAVLLFYWLLKKLFSFKVAYLSSLLLIFSPFIRSSLIQPMPEMLVAFTVVLSAFFIYHYAKNPTTSKLIIFSLIIGILLLGKMFYAISFFVVLLAIYFRRYKEGIIFFFIHLAPFFLWYLFVTQVWKISYFINEVQAWDMGVWMLNIFHWPWYKTAQIVLNSVPDFVEALIYSFLLIPIIFSVIGWSKLPFKSKRVFYFGSLFSVFLLCFVINLYLYRHVFLLFPIIYPTCILGIDRIANFLKRYKAWYSTAFCATMIILMIVISNIDIYQIFNYLKS